MINYTSLSNEEFVVATTQRIPKHFYLLYKFQASIFIVLGILGLIRAASNDDMYYYLLSGFYLLIGLLSIPVSSKKILNRITRIQTKKRKNDIENRIEFYEDGFMITSNQSRVFVDNLFRFTEIKGINYSKDYLYIYLKKIPVIILKINGFKDTSLEEVLAYLKQNKIKIYGKNPIKS